MRGIVRILVPFVALAAFVSGCGGSYKGLTKEEFLRQASASCAQASKDREDLAKKIDSKSSPEERAKIYLDDVLPLLDHALDQVAELKPPKADRERVEQIIEQARSDADAFAAQLEQDPKEALSPNAQPFQKSSASAKAYGLRICVS